MGRALLKHIRIFALIAALALANACKEREQLEKQAPALARADFTVDRIAVAGVVSVVPALGDPAESREGWSVLIGDHLGRDRFGKLPIVSSSEVRAILGREDYGVMLDRYKADGQCDSAILAELHTALEGKARFVVFGGILEDQIEWSQTESEDKKAKTKTKVMRTSRTTWVRLRFYDLTNQQLAWDHRTFGITSTSKEHDMSDIIKHGSGEGFLGGLATSIVNSALKPEPKYPPTPALESTLAKAFDSVGTYLKPRKKR